MRDDGLEVRLADGALDVLRRFAAESERTVGHGALVTVWLTEDACTVTVHLGAHVLGTLDADGSAAFAGVFRRAVFLDEIPRTHGSFFDGSEVLLTVQRPVSSPATGS